MASDASGPTRDRSRQFRFQGSTDPYPGGEMLSGSGSNVDSDLTFKSFVADPILLDGFESSDTSEWTTTVPPV